MIYASAIRGRLLAAATERELARAEAAGEPWEALNAQEVYSVPALRGVADRSRHPPGADAARLSPLRIRFRGLHGRLRPRPPLPHGGRDAGSAPGRRRGHRRHPSLQPRAASGAGTGGYRLRPDELHRHLIILPQRGRSRRGEADVERARGTHGVVLSPAVGQEEWGGVPLAGVGHHAGGGAAPVPSPARGRGRRTRGHGAGRAGTRARGTGAPAGRPGSRRHPGAVPAGGHHPGAVGALGERRGGHVAVGLGGHGLRPTADRRGCGRPRRDGERRRERPAGARRRRGSARGGHPAAGRRPRPGRPPGRRRPGLRGARTTRICGRRHRTPRSTRSAAVATGASGDAPAAVARPPRPSASPRLCGRVPAPWPTVSVLGFPLHRVDVEEAGAWLLAEARRTPPSAAVGRRGRRHRSVPPCRIAVSFNPELVMRAIDDPAAAEAVLDADLCFPDGVGAVWAAGRQGVAGLTRVPGIELAERLLAGAARGRPAGLPAGSGGGRGRGSRATARGAPAGTGRSSAPATGTSARPTKTPWSPPCARRVRGCSWWPWARRARRCSCTATVTNWEWPWRWASGEASTCGRGGCLGRRTGPSALAWSGSIAWPPIRDACGVSWPCPGSRPACVAGCADDYGPGRDRRLAGGRLEVAPLR